MTNLLPGRVAEGQSGRLCAAADRGVLVNLGVEASRREAGAQEIQMTRLDQSASRLSMRNSILVWVAGIVIGWGCAVVLFYQLIRDSAEEGRNPSPIVAESRDAAGVANIEPAAGPAEGTSSASVSRIQQAGESMLPQTEETKPAGS